MESKGGERMRDEKIVSLYFQRDEQAIRETQKKYEKYLYKVAFNILSNAEDSKESVNDTYLAAWNSIPPNKPLFLITYLAKITRRISIDRFRKSTRNKRIPSEYIMSLDELQECIADNNTPEKEFELEILISAINEFLASLPETSRNLFICRYFFCDSLEDTAKYCGISTSAAKSRLFRIREQLKEHLIKEGFII